MSKCTCETGETCPVHCSYILKLEAENAKLREIIAECADDFAAASETETSSQIMKSFINGFVVY